MPSPRLRAGALVCALVLAITGVAVSMSHHDVASRPELVATRSGPAIDYSSVYAAIQGEQDRQVYLQGLYDHQQAQERARVAQVARQRVVAASRARAVVRAAQAAPAVTVASVSTGPVDCMANHGPKWRMPSQAMAHQCWDGLLAQYGWNVSVAFNKMWCESGGNPYAVGRPTKYGTAQGLMQILPGGSFDPATNMQQAWQKYQGAGGSWSPWVC